MYITAHRVKSSQGAVGINAFLHEHTSDEWSRLGWSPPSILAVAEGVIGRTVAQRCDLAPGGNSVLSYLDVAAPERTTVSAVETALDELRRLIETAHAKPYGFESPVSGSHGEVGYRFGAVMGLWDQALDEYDELRIRVMDLLGSERRVPVTERKPLRILMLFDKDGYHFRLSPESEQQVREAHAGGPWVPARLHIGPDEMMAFENIHGDIYPHVVIALTG
ncbi:MAG: hypothetical protein FJ109_19515, partial [Deltaproteobacteria bacterium]|nr:hypothetical protein [Deltaproteobacteria bacterium]